MAKRRYSWYMLMKVLTEHFNIQVRWTAACSLQFSGPQGPVTVVKENNPNIEFVVAILSKLGLTLSAFDEGYDSVVRGI